MDTIFWTELVPILTLAGGLGAAARQFLLRPWMAARAVKEEAERQRVDRLASELTETRREMHLLCRALFELRERIAVLAEGDRK